MSYILNKPNSKLLTNKFVKSNLLSPKSVSTYIKEFKEEELIKQQSFTPSKLKEDPTHLKNILNALKGSSKGHRISQLSEENSDESEICDFRNVGDLSNISFPGDNSFTSTDDRNVKEQTDDDIIYNHDKSLKFAEEPNGGESDLDDSWSDLNLEILMGKIQLEQERFNDCQMKRKKVREAYLGKLFEIRVSTLQKLANFRMQSQQMQIVELQRLEQMNHVANEEASLIEKNYVKDVKQKKEEILKEVEALSLVEAKRTSLLEGLINSLHEPLNTFRKNLISLQSETNNIAEGSELHKILFMEFPSILEGTELTVSQMSVSHTTEVEAHSTAQRLADAVKILEDIQKLLNQNREHESSETQNISQSSTVMSSDAVTSSCVLPSESKSSESLSVSQEPAHVDKKIDVSFSAPGPSFGGAEEVFQSLKEVHLSVIKEAQETRDNTQLRPLLSRAIGIVNTFHNERHDSSNRGKLQQLLNLLTGRSFSVGSDTVSTKNNPSAQAFVKEQVATRLVILSHDKQVASMAIYASLIVRLWQLVPQIGELILFKMYETCPFLVPLAIRRNPSQTEEEFHRSLGFRHKEGNPREPVDQYLTRMGAMAQLYGRIVCMEIENHPHGIQEGWKWLARTLRTPPYPSVTPSLLNGFLTVAGAPLLNAYGNQFVKMLQMLSLSYMARIEEDVLEGGHSDIVALKNLLSEFKLRRRLPPVSEGYKLLL